MKNIILIIILIIIYSCGNRKAQVRPINGDSLVKNSIIKSHFRLENNIDLLKGVWAENEEDNALFSLDGQYINYTDDPEKYTYTVSGDTVILDLQPTAKLFIIKVTKDSLWFTDDFNEDTTKLYKRK